MAYYNDYVTVFDYNCVMMMMNRVGRSGWMNLSPLLSSLELVAVEFSSIVVFANVTSSVVAFIVVDDDTTTGISVVVVCAPVRTFNKRYIFLKRNIQTSLLIITDVKLI